MAASVRLVRPEIPLAKQLKGLPENKGTDYPLQATTRFGTRLKAKQWVGLLLSQIRQEIYTADTKASGRPKPIPEISLPRQLARIETNQGKILPFDLRTAKGHKVRLKDALGLSLLELEKLCYKIDHVYTRTYEPEGSKGSFPALNELDARVKALKSFQLENFGMVVEVIVREQIWEVLIGPEVPKLEERGINLEEIISRNAWALENRSRILTDIDGFEAKMIVGAINKRFGLKVDLLNEEVSGAVSRKFINELLARGIFWFYDQKGQMVVSNIYVRGIDPKKNPRFGSLLIGRAKPIQLIGRIASNPIHPTSPFPQLN